MILLFVLAVGLGATLALLSPAGWLLAACVAAQLVHVVRERRTQWRSANSCSA